MMAGGETLLITLIMGILGNVSQKSIYISCALHRLYGFKVLNRNDMF